MTCSKVYFTDFHHGVEDNFIEKFERFLRKAGIEELDYDRKFIAIKIHFGEYGNMVYLRPGYTRTVASIVKEHGGMPFAVDCNTLYAGRRKNALEHLDTAAINGFNSLSLGCNVIIGDGLKGDDDVEIPIDGEFVKNAKIGRAIADADIIITINHFKCHEMAGIGGALKNLAMGCASRRGKMEQHANGKVQVEQDKCIGCKKCTKMCAAEAISVEDKKNTSKLDELLEKLCAEFSKLGLKPEELKNSGILYRISGMNQKQIESATDAQLKQVSETNILLVDDM